MLKENRFHLMGALASNTWRRIRDIGGRSYFQEFIIRQSIIFQL